MKKSLLSAVALTAMVAFGGTAYADILIGVGGPLTGPNAAFGAQLQKGAEQAAADINAAGGINGEQIKIVLGDDVSDPKQGVSVANKFVADGVKFVIGHFNSAFRSRLLKSMPKTASCRSRRPPPTRSSPSAACGTPSVPAVVTTSKVRLPVATSPSISRTQRSPSCTTRPPMARVWPTKPRRP